MAAQEMDWSRADPSSCRASVQASIRTSLSSERLKKIPYDTSKIDETLAGEYLKL